MCELVNRLDTNLNIGLRLTQNSEDVLDVLRMTEIINGKAIFEAIEYDYYDNETKAFTALAKASSYTKTALQRAYQAYKGELKIRFALRAKLEAEQKKIEADRQKTLAISKTKADKAEAEREAKKKLSFISEFANESEAKLKALSDEAKRELAKGTTVKGSSGKTNPEAVAVAVAVLEKLPPKATVEDVKEYRSQFLDENYGEDREVTTNEREAEKLIKIMDEQAKALADTFAKYNKLDETFIYGYSSDKAYIEVCKAFN